MSGPFGYPWEHDPPTEPDPVHPHTDCAALRARMRELADDLDETGDHGAAALIRARLT